MKVGLEIPSSKLVTARVSSNKLKLKMYTEIVRPAVSFTWTMVMCFLLCPTRPKLIQASDVLPNAKMIDLKNLNKNLIRRES